MLSFTDTVNPGKVLPQLDGEVSTHCIAMTPWTTWNSVHRALVRFLAQTSILRTTRAKLCRDHLTTHMIQIFQSPRMGAGWSPSGPDEKGRIAPHEPKRQPLMDG